MNKIPPTVIAAMLLTMAAFTVAGPASADTDCPKDGWTKTDGSQGSVTGELGLITWYGDEVWWDIDEGYEVSICAQATETVAWTACGPEKEAAQVSEQDVTSLSYIVRRETVTQQIPVKVRCLYPSGADRIVTPASHAWRPVARRRQLQQFRGSSHPGCGAGAREPVTTSRPWEVSRSRLAAATCAQAGIRG